MNFTVDDSNRRESIIDELLDTFRTSFWLDEHHWFVRCEWNPRNGDDDIYLYTLPYCFEKVYDLNPNRRFKSTCSDDRDYWSYDSVRELWLGNKVKTSPYSLFASRTLILKEQDRLYLLRP